MTFLLDARADALKSAAACLKLGARAKCHGSEFAGLRFAPSLVSDSCLSFIVAVVFILLRPEELTEFQAIGRA